jgi:general secretion pathway protein N
MMRRGLLFGVLFLAAYAVALIATLPAERALDWAAGMARDKGLNVAASGITGTVWHGSAANAAINGTNAGRVEWSLSPWRLAIGQVKLHWRAEPSGGWAEGDAVIGGDATTLRNLEGNLPAPLLLAWFSRGPGMINVGGNVVLHVDELVRRAGKIESARAMLLWQQAALVQPAAVRFGDIRMEFTPAPNGAVAGKLSDGGGPVGLAGSVMLNADLTYRLDATLTPRPGGDPVLASTIPMLGRPDGKGGYQVVWAGRLAR